MITGLNQFLPTTLVRVHRGLMSYGPSLLEASRLIGIYSGKILRGANAAELPVEQHTRVEFVINLKTAKVQRLAFSLPLLGRADEVIE